MVIKTKDILPATSEIQLTALGQNLKQARKRRRWSVDKVRKDIRCSKGTLEDAEKGRPTVSLGVYISLFDLYGFDINLDTLTRSANDLLGQALDGTAAPSSQQKTKISPSDF